MFCVEVLRRKSSRLVRRKLSVNHWAKNMNHTLVSVDGVSVSRRNSAATARSSGQPATVSGEAGGRWRPVNCGSFSPVHVV